MVRLSTYMSEAAARPLPPHIVQETKHHILDTIAAMISGAELIPGQHALRFARAYGGALRSLGLHKLRPDSRTIRTGGG